MVLHRNSILAALGAALLLCTTSGTAGATSPSVSPGTSIQPGHEENLGQTLPDKILSQEQSQGFDSQGNPQVYWVTAGNDEVPPMFQVTDVRSRQVVFAERLRQGVDSWANTFSAAEDAVYFATTDGDFYTWAPGDLHVSELAFPYADQRIWRLAAAPDGVIYGGTYPGGQLFSYDPTTGTYRNYGQIIPAETYARALAVDDNWVYVGTQPHAKLARVDRETGAITQVPLPALYANEKAVYDMTLAGGYLFARVETVNDVLVFDTSTLELVHTVSSIAPRAISSLDPAGTHVYYRRAGQGIVELTLGTWEERTLGWNPNAFPGTWAWIDMQSPDFPGPSLSMTYYSGRIYVYNLQSKKSLYINESGLQGAPTRLQAVGVDSSGTVYTGGYLTPPGISAYDPVAGTYQLLRGGGQVEGFGTYGNDMVYGRYPGGQLYRFNPALPWSMGTNPGAAVTIGDEQDRPQAFVQIDDRVAVGSVPLSGRLGGALSIWNPSTGDISVHRGVVPNQSVVSLALADGLVVGGSSINGGYGIEPVAKEAELFVYDLATGRTLSSTPIIPGAQSINGLRFDERGILWGIADGTLFAAKLDRVRGTVEVTHSEQLFGVDRSMYGQDRSIVFRRGLLYATSGGSLWAVNSVTWRATRLVDDGAKYLKEGLDGKLYYTKGFKLYRWVFDDAPQAPDCTTFVGQEQQGPLVVASGVVCALGSHITGPVVVSDGASLVLSSARVDGPISANAAATLWLFDLDLRGPLNVTGSTGRVLVDSSTIEGPASLIENQGEVVFTASTVRGPLRCSENTLTPIDAGQANLVTGPALGQCGGW